jgi:hypothetical protein
MEVICMERITRLLISSIVLGVISACFFVLERLAMTDIFHGEPDLTLEWNIVSVSFLPILVFHLVSIVAAALALRQVKRNHA